MGYSFRYVLGAVILIAVLFAGLSLVPTAVNQWLANTGKTPATSAPVSPVAPATPSSSTPNQSSNNYTLPVPPPPSPQVNRQSGPAVIPPRKTGSAPSGQAVVRGNRNQNTMSPGSTQLQPSQPNQGNQQIQPSQPTGQSINSSWGSVMPMAYQQPVDGQGSKAIGWRFLKSSIILRKSPGGEGYRAPSASLERLLIVGGSRVWAISQEDDWVLVRSPGRTMGWVEADMLTPISPEVMKLYGGA